MQKRHNMSILQYFTFKSTKPKTNVLPIVEKSVVSEREYGSIVESINKSRESKGRKTFEEDSVALR